MFKLVLFTVLTMCIAGCAHQVSHDREHSFSHSYQETLLSGELLFESALSAEDTPDYDPFELPNYIHTWLVERGHHGRTRNLGKHLKYLVENNYGIGFRYNDRYTGTVEDAFLLGQGNCLTYSMLVHALAREMGVKTEFRLVMSPPQWDLIGDGSLRYLRHINVGIELSVNEYATYANQNSANFSRKHVQRRTRSRRMVTADISDPQNRYVDNYDFTIVEKSMVTSMYFSNVSATEILNGNYRKALAYLQRSIDQAPNNVDAWINLALLYRRHEQNDAALSIYKYLESIDPDEYLVLSGLAHIHADQGNDLEAQHYKDKINSVKLRNPYYHYNIALNKIQDRNLALSHINRAIELDATEPLFYRLKGILLLRDGQNAEAASMFSIAGELFQDASQQQKMRTKFTSLSELTINQ